MAPSRARTASPTANGRHSAWRRSTIPILPITRNFPRPCCARDNPSNRKRSTVFPPANEGEPQSSGSGVRMEHEMGAEGVDVIEHKLVLCRRGVRISEESRANEIQGCEAVEPE